MKRPSPIVELFGVSISSAQDWSTLSTAQQCPFSGKKCFKIRKSDPSISIGTCIIRHGRIPKDLVICPNRFLSEEGQVFADTLHLLTNHEPGNQLHIVPEVSIPGGTVDYFLVSMEGERAIDFVGVEFQALDTTGTIWPHRQAFLKSKGLSVGVPVSKSMGINWKMTAKTTLVQLHHKVATFEAVGRRLVLVLQQDLMEYMAREFSFDHLEEPKLGNAMHFHPYQLKESGQSITLKLLKRRSTNADGIGMALNLRQNARLELATILSTLESKVGLHTRFNPVRT